jgi:hypothetical protein
MSTPPLCGCVAAKVRGDERRLGWGVVGRGAGADDDGRAAVDVDGNSVWQTSAVYLSAKHAVLAINSHEFMPLRPS